ncbi:MAG: YitT family protein [Flavobacteriaceae bacterium]|jgi:uncharacterized membrane-anchored protein YitT (DUF2179 family)|nr:YitT family protein [Flavobacteriaceae bacterium]
MNIPGNIIKFFKIDRSRKIENIQRLRYVRRLGMQIKKEIRDAFFIMLGILSAGFGLKGFLIPNKLIDGGVTGISLLINHQTQMSLSVLLIVINIPFLLLGYRQISWFFSLKSIVSIGVLAVVIAFVPYPIVTHDKILVAIFGGFFLGAGIGLVIRGGAVIDGTEILAIHLSRNSSLTVGDFILIFNILIFSVAAYLLSVEIALYSVVTYLAASKTVDFILDGIEEYTGVTIISSKSRQISEMIKNRLGHGLTHYSGRKGFGKRGESDKEIDIIFTVITRLEINRLAAEVEGIDPHAFIIMQSIRDTHGGMVKKIALKEKKR